MIGYLAAQMGLGVAGFDPIGAMLIAGALVAGARRRNVLVFAVACLIATVAMGVALSLLAGPLLAVLGTVWPLEDEWWLLIETAAALGLLAWAIRRLLRRARPQEEDGDGTRRTVRGIGAIPMAITGALWGIAAATDPSFYGAVVLGARQGIGPLLAGLLVWHLVSQLPLNVLTAAVAVGRHRRVTTWMRAVTRRWSGAIGRAVTVLILAVSALLAADVIVRLATGQFLIG